MSARARKRLGLALGSGAARGLAHIGVLKVLQAEGIRIDCIAGTSIGAFIGALFAAGVPIGQIEEVARNVDWRRLAGLVDPIIPTSGIIDGKKVSRFMAELLPVQTFEELDIPLAVTATDVETGEGLIIREGRLLEALRAAVAFPGIFTPMLFGDRFLVDGGLCNPVPADVATSLGADIVIGVCTIPEVNKQPTAVFLTPQTPAAPRRRLRDLFTSQRVEKLLRELWSHNGQPEEKEAPARRERRAPGILKVCAQSVAIMENQINALRLARNHLDLLIRPEFTDFNLLEFQRAEEAIRAGEEATRRQLGSIRALTDGH